jgi:hypothetical protein
MGHLGLMGATDDIPRFDWPAIKAMVTAPAYFARAADMARTSAVDRSIDAGDVSEHAQASRLNGSRNQPVRRRGE